MDCQCHFKEICGLKLKFSQRFHDSLVSTLPGEMCWTLEMVKKCAILIIINCMD